MDCNRHQQNVRHIFFTATLHQHSCGLFIWVSLKQGSILIIAFRNCSSIFWMQLLRKTEVFSHSHCKICMLCNNLAHTTGINLTMFEFTISNNVNLTSNLFRFEVGITSTIVFYDVDIPMLQSLFPSRK